MVSVQDVAAYILNRLGSVSSMKLQKLVYYSQAWHLVWDEEPLFPESIQAWANGPVVYELFQKHRGLYTVAAPWRYGRADNLAPNEKQTIDAVLDDYGSMSGRQLSHLTHSERPWAEARGDLPATALGSTVIDLEALQTYYGSLDTDDESIPVVDVDWDVWDRF